MEGLDLHPRARLVQQTAQGSAAWLTEPFNEFGGTTEDKVFETMVRMRLLMNSPGTDKAPTAGMQHCCARKGIFQARICGNPEHAFIDVVMATGWAPNDREAERQMEDPLRS